VNLAGECETGSVYCRITTTVVSVSTNQEILLLKGTKKKIHVYDTMPVLHFNSERARLSKDHLKKTDE
jgi:c-di-GMP-binding flagellar brake protein YcgR